MASGLLATAQDALDVYLRSEANHVGGFGQVIARLFPGWQRLAGVGVDEGFRSVAHTGSRWSV
jgi:hypothetical protein